MPTRKSVGHSQQGIIDILAIQVVAIFLAEQGQVPAPDFIIEGPDLRRRGVFLRASG